MRRARARRVAREAGSVAGGRRRSVRGRGAGARVPAPVRCRRDETRRSRRRLGFCLFLLLIIMSFLSLLLSHLHRIFHLTHTRPHSPCSILIFLSLGRARSSCSLSSGRNLFTYPSRISFWVILSANATLALCGLSVGACPAPSRPAPRSLDAVCPTSHTLDAAANGRILCSHARYYARFYAGPPHTPRYAADTRRTTLTTV